MDFYSKIDKVLHDIEDNNALRRLRILETAHKSDINFSTNDYLALAQNLELLESFYQEYSKVPLTASSSRLLSGNHLYYDMVERRLEDLYASKSALFFNSGYHLNIGVLPSLTSKNDLILADKLVHASLIEGLKLSSAKVIRYKHLDYGQLENILSKNFNIYDNVFIVSESIYSMDGDLVDIDKLVDLKKRFGAYLYLDEAHAVGVMGEKGLGLAEQKYKNLDVDFLVGTMGKALASVGAYLITSENVKKYLVNKCRSLIYTTALPPINLAWSFFILNRISDFSHERKDLSEKSKYLKNQLNRKGVEVRGDSHILAIIVGENKKCIDLANKLSLSNIKVQAIRPPTVPEGTARIRISLHQKLTYQDLDFLVNKLTREDEN